MNVRSDERCGHISLYREGQPADTTFTDMGNGQLRLWAWTQTDIDPTTARTLAVALNAWAAARDLVVSGDTGGEHA